jgi:hypothetical protein
VNELPFSIGQLGFRATSEWEIPPRPSRNRAAALRAVGSNNRTDGRKNMLGKIAGAFIGNKIAGRNAGVKGALLGAAGGHVARRGLGGLGTMVALGYGAKKLYDWNRSRKTSPRYPASATPGTRGTRTHGV